MNSLTLIIPAKNEMESLPFVLNELKNYKYNILVVLHSSDEETINAIRNFDIEIVYQKDYGYGDALITGIQNTKTDYCCIFNADGSFKPDELDLMMKKINEDDLDLVFGSRYSKNGKSDDDTFITLIGNYIFSTLGKIFFKLKINDILYTYVLGKTIKLNNLNLNSKDFAFCVELPIKAKKNRYCIGEIGCHERSRFAGQKKVNAFKDGMLILIKMIKLFFK
tara:strand:+ start:1926 stop:2591 length:666 start_codon:yes stop_codon:yes gene_type:complete